MAKPSTFNSPAGAGSDAPRRAAALPSAAWTDAALQAFIAQHDSRIYGLARAILKNTDWAEDALQETYLRVLQQPPPESNPDMWVLKIARNVCLDICRRRKIRGELDVNDEAAAPGVAEDSPLDAAIAQEDLATLTRAIDVLPAGLREILVLRFFHNLEPADIGQVLNISGGNARIRLFRALQELKRILTEPGRTA